MKQAVPVIVAGGGGTRLWPLSRELYPKQFLALGEDRSLLQQTLLRLHAEGGGLELAPPIIICNEEHRFLVQEQAQALGQDVQRIVLEPEGRNTAPALTAVTALFGSADPIMIVMPADHYVADTVEFRACLERACAEASAGRIVALGATPARAETGYGYIRCESKPGTGSAAIRILKFVEKPDLATAQSYLQAGDYLWNCGIFIMKSSVWQAAIRRFRPDVQTAAAAAVASGKADGTFFRLSSEAFRASPSVSIDYAVMEPAAGSEEFPCVVVPCSAGWSDIGSWRAIWEIGNKDENQNLIRGDVVTADTRNSLILGEGRLVAVLGCDNIAIVETPDAILAANLSASQSLGEFVRALKHKGREEAVAHHRVFRPWGSFESIVQGDAYQVKRLVVTPGRKLSLQMHHHRAEHWVVVKGTATVVRGEETLTLHENESIYIPRETRHRLGNDGTTPLEVIEVQTGDYLGEDDIVRFADDFGRLPETKV